MAGTSGISPCFAFHYRYNGPNPSLGTSPFTIHCTLEKGAEAYYSGIRVAVIANKVGYDDDFAKAEIQARRPAGRQKTIAGSLVTIEPSEDKDEVLDINALPNDGLLLCTLIFELVDLSNATWSSASIRLARIETSTTGPIQTPDTHRVLYEYAKRTTTDSPSCFLLLVTQHTKLGRRLKPNNPSRIACAHPVRTIIGPPTHGFQILPPTEERPLFVQPPPEILYIIFSILARGGGYKKNWRKGLVSMSLVCRAWTNTALCVVYEDLDRSPSRPNIAQLAMTLKDNPMWGMHIKRFSPYCFALGAAVRLQESALTILKTASNIRRLLVLDVSDVLVEEFVEAFCKMTELRDFTQHFNGTSVADDEAPAKTYLNAAHLAKCFAHWPKLRQATIYKLGQPFTEDSVFVPAQCALEKIRFEHGTVSMAQLRAMTAASQDTLHSVVLKSIRGISNKELASWLIDFGANLKSLELESNVFTRSEAEELAVDAAIRSMPKLLNLKIEGPVATVLTFLRFEPIDTQSKYRGRRQIQIRDPMLFDPHAFVVALRTTKWDKMDIRGLRMSEENSELAEEAKRVANERGINLWMPT